MDPNSKITRGVLAAGLAAALVAGALAADVQALRLYEDAVNRFHAGDVKGAVIQLRNSLQRDPTQLPARVLMGQILLDQGALPEAEEELVMAAKLGADPASIALPLAQARNRQGKHEQVLEELNPTAYPVGIRADLWVELARARQRGGDKVGADIALAEALKLAPHHQDAMLTRAGSWLEQRDYEQAARAVNDILGRYPESAPAWLLMGRVYHAQGEFDSAVAHYRQALKLAPGSQQARLGEALALLDGGDTEQAAQILQQMRADQPLALEPHYLHAQALRALGDDAGAAVALGDAAELVNSVTPVDLGENPALLSLAAKVKIETGEYEGAYTFLSRYLELVPGEPWVTKQLARLLVVFEKPGDALRLLTRLRMNNPDDPEILVMLGDVNAAMGDYLAAERYYQFAVEEVEATPELAGRIGLNQLRQGRTEAAIDVFRGIVGDSPLQRPGASIFLGVLYLSDGRVDEAAVITDRIIASDPQNLVARNLRALVAVAQGDHQRGRALLEELLELRPDFHPAQINLVKLDILQRRFDQADKRVSTLMEGAPDNTSVLHQAARLAAARGANATAIGYLEQIRELDPRAVEPLTELTRVYLQADETARALEVATALERELPRSFEAKTNLARVQLARDEPVVAQSLLLEAARLVGPGSGDLVAVARLQWKAGAQGEAEKNLLKAVELAPDAVAPRRELAALMNRQDRHAEALEHLSAALELAPDDVRLLTMLADTHLDGGRVSAAISIYEKAREISDSPAIMVRLHRVLKLGGQSERAFAELAAWDRENPDQPLVMRVLADDLHARGDTFAAIGLYRRLTELVPASVIAHNNLANLLLPIDSERALRAALRAYELAPANATVLDTLGWTLVQLGQLQRGLAHLREAVARSSRSPTLRYHLAVALEEYGNKKEAVRELKMALALSASFPEKTDAELRLENLRSSDY